MAFNKRTAKSFDFSRDVSSKKAPPPEPKSSKEPPSSGFTFLKEIVRLAGAGAALATLTIRPVDAAGTPSTSPPQSPTLTTFLTAAPQSLEGTQPKQANATTTATTTSPTSYLGGVFIYQKGDNDWMTKCWNDQGFQVDCATWTGYHYTWDSRGLPISATAGISSATSSNTSGARSLRKSLMTIMAAVAIFGYLPTIRAASTNVSTSVMSTSTKTPTYLDPLNQFELPQAVQPYSILESLNPNGFTCNPEAFCGMADMASEGTLSSVCVPGGNIGFSGLSPTDSLSNPALNTSETQYVTLISQPHDYLPAFVPGCQLWHPDGNTIKWDCVPAEFCGWVTNTSETPLPVCANRWFQAPTAPTSTAFRTVARPLKISSAFWVAGLLILGMLSGAGAISITLDQTVSTSSMPFSNLGMTTSVVVAAAVLIKTSRSVWRSWKATRDPLLSPGAMDESVNEEHEFLARDETFCAVTPSGRTAAVRISSSNETPVKDWLRHISSFLISMLTFALALPVAALQSICSRLVAAYDAVKPLKKAQLTIWSGWALTLSLLLTSERGVTAGATAFCDSNGQCALGSLPVETIGGSSNRNRYDLLQCLVVLLMLLVAFILGTSTGRFIAEQNLRKNCFNNHTSECRCIKFAVETVCDALMLGNERATKPTHNSSNSESDAASVPPPRSHLSLLSKLLFSFAFIALFLQNIPQGATAWNISSESSLNITASEMNPTSSYACIPISNGTECRALEGKKGELKVPKGGGGGAVSGADMLRPPSLLKPIMLATVLLLMVLPVASGQNVTIPQITAPTRYQPYPMETQVFYNTYTVLSPYRSAGKALSVPWIFRLLRVKKSLSFLTIISLFLLCLPLAAAQNSAPTPTSDAVRTLPSAVATMTITTDATALRTIPMIFQSTLSDSGLFCGTQVGQCSQTLSDGSINLGQCTAVCGYTAGCDFDGDGDERCEWRG